jgi:hypothetical protein
VPELQPILYFLTPLSLLGLVLAIRRRIPCIYLFTTLLIFYPLVYYFTFPTDRYRHTIEPEMLILATFWVVTKIRPGKSTVPDSEA